MTKIYIKQLNGQFYIGDQASDEARGFSERLGRWFIRTPRLSSAQAIANDEARRIHGVVVICEPLIG